MTQRTDNKPASESSGLKSTAERLAYSVTEAAGVLGISRASAYECVRTGELPSLRLGGRILIPRRLLEQLIEGDDHGEVA